jgi:hypothetical protein
MITTHYTWPHGLNERVQHRKASAGNGREKRVDAPSRPSAQTHRLLSDDTLEQGTRRREGRRWHVIRSIPHKTNNMSNLLYIIAVIMIIGWLLGVFVYSATGLIHLLLVIALVAVLLRVIQGKGISG